MPKTVLELFLNVCWVVEIVELKFHTINVYKYYRIWYTVNISTRSKVGVLHAIQPPHRGGPSAVVHEGFSGSCLALDFKLTNH